MSESEDKNYSDTEVERSPLARFRSEAMKYQHTISAGTASTFRLPVVFLMRFDQCKKSFEKTLVRDISGLVSFL